MIDIENIIYDIENIIYLFLNAYDISINIFYAFMSLLRHSCTIDDAKLTLIPKKENTTDTHHSGECRTSATCP